MAAPPSVNPAPPAPAFALGLGQDNTILDWSGVRASPIECLRVLQAINKFGQPYYSPTTVS